MLNLFHEQETVNILEFILTYNNELLFLLEKSIIHSPKHSTSKLSSNNMWVSYIVLILDGYIS